MRWALWWFAVFAAYVVAVVTQTGSEIIAGAVIGGLCTIVVAVAYVNGDPDIRVQLRWLRHLAAVPMRMLSDALGVSGRIVWSLTHGEELVGMFMRLKFHYGSMDDPWDRGREALAIYGVCAAPNSMVTEVDRRGEGELVVHKLFNAPQPAQSPEWPV